jgi:hypothetical protein
MDVVSGAAIKPPDQLSALCRHLAAQCVIHVSLFLPTTFHLYIVIHTVNLTGFFSE